MSAPETNVERQTSQHKAPLAGIILAVVVAIGIILFLLGGLLTDAAPSPEAETGAITPTELQEGDVAVPDTAPSRTITPDASDTTVIPDN